MAAQDAHGGHDATRHDGRAGRVSHWMHRTQPFGKDAVFGPREHQTRHGQDHRRQVVREGNRRTRDNQHRSAGTQQHAQQPWGCKIARGGFGRDEPPRHRVIHSAGKREVERGGHDHREADRARQVASRVPCLATGLRDRVEADEAREEYGRRRQEDAQVEWRRRLDRQCAMLPHQERRREIMLVEAPSDNDHDRAGQKHQHHEWNERALVCAKSAHVDQHESPQQHQRQYQPHDAVLQCGCRALPIESRGNVAQEGRNDVRHHANGDAEAEPLRKRRNESEIRTQRATRIQIAATGSWHGRGQHGVRERRQ